MKLRIIIFALTLSNLFGLEAQFHADSLHGSLGDIISFSWYIQHPENATLNFSELNMEGTGIEVLDRELNSIPGGSQLQISTAVYDSVGVYTFPSTVVYASDGEGLDSLFLRGPVLQITSVLSPSDTSFRDIKGLHDIRTPVNLIYLLLFIGVLLLIYVIYYIVKHRRQRSQHTVPKKIIVPPEEAHVLALRAFATLKKSKYIKFEQYKEFYSELTRILKQYYENRFLVDALEQTTSEFLITMNSMSEFDTKMITDTQGILEKADFIKFAQARSDELESGKALTLAIDLVNRSKVQSNQGDKT